MAPPDIHPSAVIEDGAVIGPGGRIGPFCHIGPQVRLGAGAQVHSHAVIGGETEIAEAVEVHSFAVVGGPPQDKKFAGERSRLIVGPRCRIREHVTINTGTSGGGGVTRIGADCLLMAGCHIAHDAALGDRVVVVNSAAIAGHCRIGDDAIIGGLAGIHQFVRIGQGAIIGALAMVTADVIPNGLVQGPRGVLDGLNLIGLKRRGIPAEAITELRAAFQALAQGEGNFQDRAEALATGTEGALVREIVDFVAAGSDRSFLTTGQG